MVCDSEKAAMNEAYRAWMDAYNAAEDVATRVLKASENVEHSCGYLEGDRYVLDPHDPSDLPPGMPLCPDAFKEWWEAYLELILLRREVLRLEALVLDRSKEWFACEHQNKHVQPA